jgi:D-glycero-D-manno-heptose 1,7-bisphosphate phosphatase
MVEIHRKPFLAYQIEQLRDQGFEKVLLLLGYLPEVVQEYCGDGGRWGIKVEYSVSAVENQTGKRLKLAEPYLDPSFLLLYCDNYWPMRMDRMWSRYAKAGAQAMITVYTNKDDYTRNSVRLDGEGFVVTYDKTCTAPGLQGVEISYAVLDKSVLELLPDANVSLEETLYPELSKRRQLLAYITDHRYYSVGALHRLPLTEAFFTRRPTVILDRDGVLNQRPARAQYVRRWNEFHWRPGAKESLHLLKVAGYRVVVVSNQAGIGRGIMTESDLAEINRRMLEESTQAGGNIDAAYYCAHDWDAGCECRKPKPGLLLHAQKELHLDLTRSLFIGDDERDQQAAEAAECRFEMVTNDNSLIKIIRKVVAHDPQQ